MPNRTSNNTGHNTIERANTGRGTGGYNGLPVAAKLPLGGPSFFRWRWAACPTPQCRKFGMNERVDQPITRRHCEGCGAQMRTEKWRGWDAALSERIRRERQN